MNNILQLLMNQKFQQIPQNLVNQLEQQLKRVNPQAYQEFQQARKNKDDPNEYLNKIVGGFTPEQKQQWESMMAQFPQLQQPKK